MKTNEIKYRQDEIIQLIYMTIYRKKFISLFHIQSNVIHIGISMNDNPNLHILTSSGK